MTGNEDRLSRGRIIQLGIGLDEELLARLDRLRACLGVSRSKVAELALHQSIARLERREEEGLRRFEVIARNAGMNWMEYAQDYAERYSRKTYPPTLEELEKLDSRAAV